MLVLSRKVGEKLRIGEATVKVVSVKGEVVRLGVEAPPRVPIDRDEVADRNRRTREGQAEGGPAA